MTTTITANDLLSTEVYALVRSRYRAGMIEMKARRRVMIGPHLSVVFESRETVLYQIQEILWAERSSSCTRIAEEIAEYERLVPRTSELTATLMLHGGAREAGQILMENLVAGRTAVFLRIGAFTIAAEALSPQCDPSCPVQYIRFPLEPHVLGEFVHRRTDVRLGAAYTGRTEIVPLPSALIAEMALDLDASRVLDAWLAPMLLTGPNSL